MIGRLLGFDYGKTKIGIAVGQTITNTARPLTTLRVKQQGPDWQRINDLIEEWQPQALVVGIPYAKDNPMAEIADLALGFARQMERRFHLQVHLVDERLSSREARNLISRKQKNIEALDAIAAQLILETWLSEQQS